MTNCGINIDFSVTASATQIEISTDVAADIEINAEASADIDIDVCIGGELDISVASGGCAVDIDLEQAKIESAVLEPVTVTPAETQEEYEPEEGVDGFNKVTVQAAPLQEKSVAGSKSSQTVNADSEYYGLKKVTVGGYTPTTETKSISISENGNYTVTKSSDKDGMTEVNITVNTPTPKEEQSKTMSLGASAPTTVTPDTGKALSSVVPSIDSSVIKAENIAEGVTILGIVGTHKGGGGLYYGASGEDFFADTTTNHTITLPATTPSAYQYESLFARGRGGYSDVTFPGTSCGSYAFEYFAREGHIKTFIADSLTRLTAGHEFYFAFRDSAVEKISFKNLTSIGGTYGFYNVAFQTSANTTLKEIDFSSLTTLAGASNAFYYAFTYCRGLYPHKVGHPFPVLATTTGTNTSLFGYVFDRGEATMYVFDKLTGIGTGSSGSYAFTYAFAANLWDYRSGDTDGRKCGVAFPLVSQVGYNNTAVYSHCKYLMSGGSNNCALYMTSLTTIYNNATSSANGHFAYCNANYIYMPKLTAMGNKPEYVFYGSTNTTELHFGIENQSTIEALTGYSSKFGASKATIYFDLANHITVDGVVYDRDGSTDDYDNWYFGFTNGSDTIYIDNYYGAVGDTTYTKSGSSYTASSTITAVA